MASSRPSTLTALQRETLNAFFERERGFFRTTDDLDLFDHGGVDAAELRGFVERLVERLRRAALPTG